ncbi:extracellular solute-binding protein [Chlorogloea sp. CCALA 695]|uniref:extracellular solute-binding protein n=1 Tax=Chlorogloea sp. CCALA 695 TaxID=2107693 RepID=UPI000D0752CE|nr:extracellular solute-binding protein [Chlorogloea sp. CCALA 695]PSB34067.1 polyamine ABC transporter substrate-binding protein [Chlorogloea sp. CCALA 695]
MDRRNFLIQAGTITLLQLLAGCNEREKQRLRVQLLKGSIPAQLLEKFKASLKQPANLEFTPVEQLVAAFDLLKSWEQPKADKTTSPWQLPKIPLINPATPEVADLLTLGDFWLGDAIAQKLIKPLDIASLPQWQKLPQRYQELVKRNAQGFRDDLNGQIWAAPYRWGNTVIVYNRDKFKSLGWTPTDWCDLWCKELRGRISLPNQPREVIGLTLKALNLSYNPKTKDLQQVTGLTQRLKDLHQQVKFYSSDRYMEPLILGDTWLAVGWSTDVIPVLQRYKELEAIVPRSGSAIWADVWVSPTKSSSNQLLAQQWIDFCWLDQSQRQISILSKAASPMGVKINPTDIQETLRSLLLVEAETLAKSEFLLPLPQETMSQIELLWQAMKP